MIPGTPHPEEMRKGINDLPDSPNLLKILSMMNATLAIYPQSSRIDRQRNTHAICGVNPSTDPTPFITPSTTRDITHPDAPRLSSPVLAPGLIHPSNSVSLAQSVRGVPIFEIASQYTRYMIATKIGRAKSLLVTILSILSEVVSFSWFAFLVIALGATLLIYAYLWLITILSASSSSSASQSAMCSSICLLSSGSRASSATTFSSLSKSLIAYHLRFSLLTIFSMDSSM